MSDNVHYVKHVNHIVADGKERTVCGLVLSAQQMAIVKDVKPTMEWYVRHPDSVDCPVCHPSGPSPTEQPRYASPQSAEFIYLLSPSEPVYSAPLLNPNPAPTDAPQANQTPANDITEHDAK